MVMCISAQGLEYTRVLHHAKAVADCIEREPQVASHVRLLLIAGYELIQSSPQFGAAGPGSRRVADFETPPQP
jgi:hypothetical protein